MISQRIAYKTIRGFAIKAGLVLALFVFFSASFASDTLDLYFTWNIRGEIEPKFKDSAYDLRKWPLLASCTKDSQSFFVDLGNTYYPGYLSRFSYGSLINELLTIARCGVKATTVQDFLLGRENVNNLQQHASHKFLSTNIADRSTKTPLFNSVVDTIISQISISFISIITSGSEWEIRNWQKDNMEIVDPVQATVRLMKSKKDTASLQICLTSKETLDKHPSLIDIPGIDVFVVGLSPFSSHNFRVREEVLSTDKRILYVPSFQDGFGKLQLIADDNKNIVSQKYSIPDIALLEPDSIISLRMHKLMTKWKAVYNKENGSLVAKMDSALNREHLEVIGNLLREWSLSEVACLEKNLVVGNALPASITASDIDRLLSSSPDMIKIKISGDDLLKMQKEGALSWIGIFNGKISGRNIEKQKFYSIITTENAYHFLSAHYRSSCKNSRFLHKSLFDILVDQLGRRRSRSYSFSHLEKRMHVWGESSIEMSFRRVDVRNPDSITILSAVSYKPFTAWNMNIKIPITLYNNFNKLDIVPKIEYAAIGDVVGKNLFELRADQVLHREYLGSAGPR